MMVAMHGRKSASRKTNKERSCACFCRICESHIRLCEYLERLFIASFFLYVGSRHYERVFGAYYVFLTLEC